MIIDRDMLENELEKFISIYAKDRKVVTAVTKELNNRNVLDGDVASIFKLTTPLTSVSQIFLYCFTVALYNATAEVKLNPTTYFTKLEIDTAKNWKQEVTKEEDKYPVAFKNVIKISDDVWLTKMTIQDLDQLFNRRVLTYNPETQRPLRRSEFNDKIIERIDVNPKAVKKIKNLVLAGRFIPNCITINILQDAEVEMEEKGGDIYIYSGSLNLNDGYHRYRGYIKALLENPNIEFTTGVMLTHFDVDKAKDFFYQEQQHNPIDPEHIKTLNPDKMSNQVVIKINEKKNSLLRGKVTKDQIMLKSNKALVMFNTLADSIEYTFQPQESKDLLKCTNVTIEGLNIIIEENDELLNEVVDFKCWVAYICLIYNVYKMEDWHTILVNTLPKIDMDQIQIKTINKTSVKNIQDYVNSVL